VSLKTLALALAVPMLLAARAPIQEGELQGVPAPAWPAGAGMQAVSTKCVFCHNPEIIQSQRLTPAQWQKEVAKMTRWGAPLLPAEQAQVADYLARHYGTATPEKPPARVHF
jgi:cytochrome c-type biogenesis protein CcmH/NrfF